MEPTDLTIRLLQEIRDSVREGTERMDRRFEQVEKRFEGVDQRFEVIETALRDLAQQMVMLSRGIKTALELRNTVDSRLEDHEKRLADLEKRIGH